MKKTSVLALVLALALCVSLLAGCGPTGGDSTEPPTSTGASTGATAAPTEPDASDLNNSPIEVGTELGQRCRDFTFTTYDGQTYSLYETLKEKKMVLINMWATWCNPCKQEFPFMEEAYEAYKDQVEIFALSCEEEDTNEVLADYVADMGMTFPVGRDEPNIYGDFSTGAIPVSVVVDRFGVICFCEVGSQTSVDKFARLFDVFLADDYTESVILTDGLPPKVPDVTPATAEELAAALNVEGGSLVFANPDGEYEWPMAVYTETDDGNRTYLQSTNVAQEMSTSYVTFQVTAQEGDALSFDYKVSSEAGFDGICVYVDGEPVKQFSGQRDWATFACALSAGDHTVTLAYEKDEASDDGDDVACFDNVALLSGDAAADALAAMPVYPAASENTVGVTTEGAKEVVINDPSGMLEGSFGIAKYFIIPGEEASFSVTLDASCDPDNTYATSGYDGANFCLADCVDGDHYTFSTGIDSMESTGYSYCYATVGFDPNDPAYIVFFNSEENLNTFLLANFSNDDGTCAATWRYADGAAPGTAAVTSGSKAVSNGSAAYQLSFVDQNGEPVEGVTVNICDDASCTPMESDANGMVSFVYPSFAYHIQVIVVPEGYEYDTTQESYLKEAGGVTEIIITKK